MWIYRDEINSIGEIFMKDLLKKILSTLGVLNLVQELRGKILPTQYQIDQKTQLEKGVKLYSQFMKKGDLCFDVGANRGNRVNIFLKMGMKVVAVEPQKECIQILKKRYGKKIIIIEKALGSKSGEATMYLSNAITLASLSQDWINKVQRSRFSNYEWNGQYTVPVVTLQHLIEQIGKPYFCKIDVEGYELEVLKGLKEPIHALSFEFAIPESYDATVKCIEYLGGLGYSNFNYSLGESMNLEVETWKNMVEMVNEVKCFQAKGISWGDIYAKIA